MTYISHDEATADRRTGFIRKIIDSDQLNEDADIAQLDAEQEVLEQLYNNQVEWGEQQSDYQRGN